MTETMLDVVTARALRDLDPLEQVALHLVYGHGLTQAQVATELHLPETTVGAAVAHGMRQLSAAITARRSPGLPPTPQTAAPYPVTVRVARTSRPEGTTWDDTVDRYTRSRKPEQG